MNLVIDTGVTVDLAEVITDNTCLVPFIMPILESISNL